MAIPTFTIQREMICSIYLPYPSTYHRYLQLSWDLAHSPRMMTVPTTVEINYSSQFTVTLCHDLLPSPFPSQKNLMLLAYQVDLLSPCRRPQTFGNLAHHVHSQWDAMCL